MPRASPPVVLLAAALATACGGNGSPTGPGGSPTPAPGSPVGGFVYYDENGNGQPDPTEIVRLPGVTVAVGARTGQSTNGGRFSVDAVPQGAQSASLQAGTLPAYFTPGPSVSVAVPQTGDLAVPAVLTLGPHAQPNVYMAFGDSITAGDGSSNHGGYRDPLYAQLRSYWGNVMALYDDGLAGTKSNKGESRLESRLAARRPAYVLILYGTNDYNDAECRNSPPCYTVDSLRSMIVQTRETGAHPVLGTIPPVSPAYADKGADARNDWVKQMNGFVRTMAAQERVALAEVHGDLLKQSNLAGLFADDKHPNDAGYALIAQSFFNAITRPVGATTASRPRGFAFRLPGS